MAARIATYRRAEDPYLVKVEDSKSQGGYQREKTGCSVNSERQTGDILRRGRVSENKILRHVLALFLALSVLHRKEEEFSEVSELQY